MGRKRLSIILGAMIVLLASAAIGTSMYSEREFYSSYGPEHSSEQFDRGFQRDSGQFSSNPENFSNRERPAIQRDYGYVHEQPTLTQLASEANTGQFDVLLAALQATDLQNVLDAERGSFTVFAPTDRAFQDFFGVSSDTAAIREFQRLDPYTQRRVLQYHITPGEYSRNDVSRNTELVTLNGRFRPRSQVIEAGIVQSNLQASNGVLHVVGGVLDPGAS